MEMAESKSDNLSIGEINHFVQTLHIPKVNIFTKHPEKHRVFLAQ